MGREGKTRGQVQEEGPWRAGPRQLDMKYVEFCWKIRYTYRETGDEEEKVIWGNKSS